MDVDARKQQSLQDENSPVSLFNFHCSFQEKSMSGGSCEMSTPTGLVIWYDPLNIFYASCETVGWVIYIYHYFSVIFEKVTSHIKSVIYSPWCPAQLTSAMMWCCLGTKHEEMVPNIIFRLKGIKEIIKKLLKKAKYLGVFHSIKYSTIAVCLQSGIYCAYYL